MKFLECRNTILKCFSIESIWSKIVLSCRSTVIQIQYMDSKYRQRAPKVVIDV